MNDVEETNANIGLAEPHPQSPQDTSAGARSGSGRHRMRLLDTYVDAISARDALHRASVWAGESHGRYICFCNVHSLVTASVRSDVADMLNDADLVLPDGAPVAWTMRMLGFGGQERVSGPDFMWDYCAVAQEQNTSIFLYGNRTATLDKLMSVMRESFPRLCVAGAHSPPFRQLSDEEDEAVIKMLNASGAGVIFVSLGCPKQELWMASRRNRINAVMFGLGAAFDYHAGSVRRAPPWMRKAGFEWLHRLTHEPRRLWKRYLIANSIFLWRAAADVSHHFSKRGRRCAFGMPPDSQGRQTYESGTVAGSQVDGLTTRETQ